MTNNKDENKKNSISLLFTNLFGNKKELSLLEEEQVQSPMKTVVNTFKSNKVAMTAFIVFFIILIIVLLGPLIKPIDLWFSETSQMNVEPGFNLMDIPDELQGNVQDISIGKTFSVATSKDGDVYIWGKTRMTSEVDIKKLPADMGKIVDVAAGYDHALYLNDQGELFASGSSRQRQGEPPYSLDFAPDIVQIEAGYQNSIAVTADGWTHYFGNSMNNDYDEFHKYQGEIEKVTTTADAVMGLTKDGEVVYLGFQTNPYSRIPENMGNVIDIATTASTVAALNDEGQVFVWGNVSRRGEGDVPETDDKIVSLQGGRYHYTGLTEDGKLVSWGDNYYEQSTTPQEIQDMKIVDFYTDFYQNYAIDESGQVHSWGLKGYLLGTDELGRDLFTRLLNGGRMSITIGAVAVIISTAIGVIVGGISGYFGGRIDMALQRISEMVNSLPFLPFAMILSALIGNSMSSNQRIYLIMVILGLLSWPSLARLVRAQILSIREQEYVIAARSLGIKQFGIIFKHILPNVISVIIVNATLNFATSMLTEATLSYLGFGVKAPQPTWGNMLYGANNSVVIQNYWWRWVFASIVLGVCVICINLVGDGLRDAIDPKSQER